MSKRAKLEKNSLLISDDFGIQKLDTEIRLEFLEIILDRIALNIRKTELKVSSLVNQYELGKISTRMAVTVLGFSRIDSHGLLSQYKVSALKC